PPPFGSSWVKRYCTFVKEQKILHMVTFDHKSGGKIVSNHSMQPGTVLTVQALSEDDHKLWMRAMGGKEPVSHPHGVFIYNTHLPRFTLAEQRLLRLI
ncbi:hypothetical protein GOODEAATRI_027735, partial [Goodea atripinnis]